MTDQVSDQVKRLLQAIGESEQTSAGLMQQLQLSHAPTFRKNYLTPPALEGSWIERTQPNSPRSPTQAYRLTPKGRHWLATRK